MSLIRPLLALTLGLAVLPIQGQAQDGDAGAYLAARAAAATSDYAEASGWYTRALLADPGNPQLLEGAIVGQIASGRVDAAIPIAQQLLATGTASQSAALVMVADQARRGAWDELIDGVAKRDTKGQLAEGLSSAWAELGAGRMSEALESFDVIAATKGSEAFGLYHKALALASVGDFEGADQILSGKAAGTIGVMRRGVLAYVQILSQLERNDDALALLNTQFGTGHDPAVDALRDRLGAGETLPFDVTRDATDGVAEVFFTLAAALNGEASDGSTLVHARMAAHIRPDLTEAQLLAADLLEAQEQYTSWPARRCRRPGHLALVRWHEVRARRHPARRRRTDAAIATLHRARASTKTARRSARARRRLGSPRRLPRRRPSHTARPSTRSTPAQHWVVYYTRGIASERAGDARRRRRLPQGARARAPASRWC